MDTDPTNAILRALLGGLEPSLDPYGSLADPMQLLSALSGPAGTTAGSVQGPWGALLGGVVPQMQPDSPFGSLSPKPQWGSLLKSLGMGYARQ